MAQTVNQSAQEKATAADAQIEMLTDLVKSLVKATEEQKQTHANQIEDLVNA
ncbi:hypothetical protein MMC08_005196 [Hypocenomyce scalaris]|nr:hypothetical protein [Hypocenomyce scalaris]